MQKNWRELIKPKKLEVDKITATYGKFVAEPLERGYGVTIGNTLRRILLSSLRGAAITSVKFPGVLHEFSTMPGVIECDHTVTVLNPELHIATVGKDGKFECELTASSGRGYVPAEKNKSASLPVGAIPIDSVFQPGVRVKFDVTHARVGQRTDY